MEESEAQNKTETCDALWAALQFNKTMSGNCRHCGYDGCVCDDNDRYNISNDLLMTDKSNTELPSRRYNCNTCGVKYRRSNAKAERLRPPICPVCEKYKMYREYVQPSSLPK